MTDNSKEIVQRLARVEKGLETIEDTMKELRAEDDMLHSRINKIIENDLVHMKRDKRFWITVLGAGGVGSIVVEFLLRYLFPYVASAAGVG